MGLEALSTKSPATLDELKMRVAHALQRHPLCCNIQFEVVGTPSTSRGSNWIVSLRSIEPRVMWEASAIIADIQDAYELSATV